MFQPHGANRFPPPQLTQDAKNDLRAVLAALAQRTQTQAGALSLLLRPPTTINPLTLQESPLGRALLFLADVAEHGIEGRPISREMIGRALALVDEVVLTHPLSGEPVHAGLLGDSLVGSILGRARLLLHPEDPFVPLAEAAARLDCSLPLLERYARTGCVPTLFLPERGRGMLESMVEEMRAEWAPPAPLSKNDPETDTEHPRVDTQEPQERHEGEEQSPSPQETQKRPRGRPVGSMKKKG
jgi:hypothetical protein